VFPDREKQIKMDRKLFHGYIGGDSSESKDLKVLVKAIREHLGIRVLGRSRKILMK
jgi:hypothetical protein